jgi:hypothetical protein
MGLMVGTGRSARLTVARDKLDIDRSGLKAALWFTDCLLPILPWKRPLPARTGGSEMGQKRRFDSRTTNSGLHLTPDISLHHRN